MGRGDPFEGSPFRVERSYEPYSDDPDYLEGNRRFSRDLELPIAELWHLAKHYI